MKNTIIALVVIAVLGVGAYFFIFNNPQKTEVLKDEVSTEEGKVPEDKSKTIIGASALGHDIAAYHFGTGEKELLFVGGIHGGYEWNTVLVAYEMMDYLKANPSVIPQNVKVTVVPVLNPDGLNKVVGTTSKFALSDVPPTEEATIPGRFNGNNVDLNRNFDCDWQTVGKWQNRNVSGGGGVFSEPESRAIRGYVLSHKLSAVLVWYSAANGVFASSCHNGVLGETRIITKVYADASGYPAYDDFNFYEITGDMVNWLAKNGIPAISVLLSTHKDVEWNKNQAGVRALLQYYAK